MSVHQNYPQLAGKTIKKAVGHYDGSTLSDLQLDFEDGSMASFMFIHEPKLELKFYKSDADQNGRKLKTVKHDG